MYITNNCRFAKSANINWLLANKFGERRSSFLELVLGFESVFSFHEEFPNVFLGPMKDCQNLREEIDYN